jgi:hypothetical protein
MKIAVLSLILLAMFILAGCATSPRPTHACGVDHVKANRLGLDVYFQPDTDFDFFAISPSHSEGPSTSHSVRKGRLVPKDFPTRPGFHPFAPRHFFLDRGGSAQSVLLFGGCSYKVEPGQRGAYLHVEGAEGDTSDVFFNEDIYSDAWMYFQK